MREVTINMVESGKERNYPALTGTTREFAIIKVGGTTRDISDELQVALSEMGLNLLTTKDGTAASTTGSSGPQGRRLRIMETVQLNLPNTRNSTNRGGATVQALIDTGADVSCISQKLAEELGIEPQASAPSVRITGAGGITPAAILPGLTVHVRNYTLQVDFLMLPLGTTNMILGLDVLSALGATITCNPMGVEFNPNVNLGPGNIPIRKVEALDRLPGWGKEVAQDSSNEVLPKEVWLVSRDNLPEDKRAVGPISERSDQTTGWADRTDYSKGVPENLYYSDNDNFEYAANGEPQISEEEFRAKLLVDFAWFEKWPEEHAGAMALLLEFRGVFARNVDVTRPIKCAPMVIHTTTEAPVGKPRPDRFTPDQRNFMDAEIQRLLRLGVIRHSTSLWNSPPILREKEGPTKWRLCHDYRELNSVSIKLPNSIPLISDVLGAIAESVIFSKMDMTQGFLQLELDENSKKKTAFTVSGGCYEYNVASLGLTNVPGYFCFSVSNIFALLRKIINSFFDDFIGHSKGKNQREGLGQHIKDLRLILQRCKDNNIYS